jgi:serine protease AprX
MTCRRSKNLRWLSWLLGAILVVATSHPAPAVGSSEGTPSESADRTGDESAKGRGPLFLAALAPPSGRLMGGLADIARRGNPSELVDVVVTYDSVQSAGRDAVASRMAYRNTRAYSRLPFRALRVRASVLDALSRGSSIRAITPDSEVMGASTSAQIAARVPGNGNAANSTNVTYTGQGVTVAIVDTGIYSHADFSGHLLGQRDFVDGAGGAPMASFDGYGHGTHVAGMVAGTGASSYTNKYQGVGTAANLIGLRVLDSDGRGQLSDVIAALDWILTTGISQYGIRVANLSLGMGVMGLQAQDPLVQAVDAVWDAGVVVVVSAGNHGSSGHFTISSPGNSRKVITVGSLTDNSNSSDNDDRVSSFSSRGPTLFDHILKPDLLAPGNKIIAPYSEGCELGWLLPSDKVFCGYNTSSCSQHYLKLSGTSMAAGLVSGAVARMLQKSPSLTPSTVKARLMKTARKIPGDPTDYGTGAMNVDAAMNSTAVMTAPALSPIMQLSANAQIAYVQDTAALWGNTQWSASYLWADGYLWTNASGMGVNGYLWSDSYLWSNSSLWADSYLWTNGFLWSDSVKPASVDVEDEDIPEPEVVP